MWKQGLRRRYFPFSIEQGPISDFEVSPRMVFPRRARYATQQLNYPAGGSVRAWKVTVEAGCRDLERWRPPDSFIEGI